MGAAQIRSCLLPSDGLLFMHMMQRKRTRYMTHRSLHPYAALEKCHHGCHHIEFVCLNLQTIDPAPIPAAQKATLRDQLASLQKRVLEGQKKAAAANKQRATQAAVADADKAVTAGQKCGVMRVDVGLDPKALLEAWNAIQKQHPKLPVIMFSTDQGKTGLWQSA